VRDGVAAVEARERCQPRRATAAQCQAAGQRPDPAGGRVITYAGWPLYTYEADSAAGQDNGQATESSGGQWYVIAPSGKVITTG